MVQTKSTDLVNVTAFTDGVMAKLGDAIKLTPLAYVENLSAESANTIQVPKFEYIGDAEKMVEGEPIDPSLLVGDTEDVSVEQAGKAVEITDKAVKSSYGDPLSEAETQIVRAIANRVEKDMFEALAEAKLAHSAGEALNTQEYLKALELFGEEQDGEHFILINPNQSANVKSDADFKDGVWEGELIISNRVPEGEAYIVKPEALGLYLAEEAEVEQDRDILAKSTVISADELYATHLRNEAKAIKITFTTGQ